MSRVSVPSRYSTGFIAVVALIVAQGAFQPVAADITENAPTNDAMATSGAYKAEDSEALLNLLEAPAPSPRADANFGKIPAYEHGDITPFRDGPQAVTSFVLEPEAKKFEAWDLKGGTIVPEPATALLMGVGLAALAVLRGRRGKNNIE